MSFPVALFALATASGAPDAARDRAFVERAREATARYHDRAAAIADGYRLIGEDFPGMGEHWIHIRLVFDGRYEVDRPEFLSYVDVGGQPRLLGVAYALPLLEGEQPPEEPAGRDAWHAHTRGVDEETLEPKHHGGHHGADHGAHGPRLAMLHAWVWLENPEGLYAADNWAIPFLRLGLDPPQAPAAEAGKALSLLSGGDGYLARAVPSAVGPAAIDAGRLRAAIAKACADAAAVVDARGGPALNDAELASLVGSWRSMWDAIDASLPTAAAQQLRTLSLR